jgi:hypothetical protein
MEYLKQGLWKKPQGFSLLELLLASSLAIILITGSAQLLFHTFQVKMRANDHLNTMRLLNSRLETLKSFPFDSQELGVGNHSLDTHDESSHRQYLIHWGINEITTDLKSIVIECSLLDRSERKTRTILYISRSLGF